VGSDTEITATSPGGQGTVDVIVSNSMAQSSATPSDHFAYPASGCVPGVYNVCAQQVNATEGVPFTKVVAYFTTADANPQPSQFSTHVNWGNGSPSDTETVVANPDGSFNLVATDTFAEEGCCENISNILISVQDLTRNRATVYTQSLPNIADATLTASGVAVSPTQGNAFQGTVATFTDADPGGTASDYAATIDWGDGTPPDQGTISAPGSGFAVTGNHTYAQCGPSTVTVQITDTGGSTMTATATATVAC
jgi:hypothetical protein